MQNDVLETMKCGSKASVDAWRAGKQDRVTKNTKKMLTSCTQHCQCTANHCKRNGVFTRSGKRAANFQQMYSKYKC